MADRDSYTISSYQRPLNLVPEHQVDQYVAILEELITDRLSELEEEEPAALFRGTEQETYESILRSLEDVENNQELYEAVDQAVNTESMFPEPFDHLGFISGSQEFLKSGYTEEVLDEAQQLLSEQTRSTRNNP